MKRSEMLKIIEDAFMILKQNQRFSANYILDTIEKAGMLPPDTSGIICVSFDKTIRGNGFNEWEPEDENT